MYDELAAEDDDALRAACGRAEIDLVLGDCAAGIDRLQALAKPDDAAARQEPRAPAADQSPDWHAMMAALLVEVGRYDETLHHNRQALAIDPRHYRARQQLGALYEMLGRIDEALEAYQPFEEIVAKGPLPDRPDELMHLGHGFVRYTTLTQNPNLVRRTRHVLQEIYQEAFDRLDAAYWPARLAAAELLLEKHSLSEARSDFEKILAQNPRVPAAHVGLGRITLEHWAFEETEKHARAALEVNPRFIPAHRLLADLRMTERRYPEAVEAAQAALATNPNSMAALATLAAAQLRAGDEVASHATQARMAQLNPTPALLHHTLGVWLSAARQFPRAEEHFKKAVEFAPTWPEPRTELGLLYMETGEEAEARRTLEASFALDSFNSRTFIVLNLLDTLDKFRRVETDNFIVKYDEERDAVLAPYFAEALEEIYPDVCGAYGASPSKKTIVELFPDHFGFSVRISTRPFIATVGACSGRVVALAAPRPESPFGCFNWRTVLRHEFAHVVTLDATENRIPHWMTEGLAVAIETAPRSWEVKHLLAGAVKNERLFTLESIDWGFIRPKRPDDRPLAYMQSEWMIEYLIEKYGDDAVPGLLKAFREGLTQPRAFERVLKIEPAAFDREFAAWASRQAGQWGLTVRVEEKPEELSERLERDPDNPELLVRLAWAALAGGALDDADSSARRALDWMDDVRGEDEEALTATRPAAELDEIERSVVEVLSHVLVARMLGNADDEARLMLIEEAEPYIRRWLELAPDNPEAVKFLGYYEQAEKNWPAAIAHYSAYLRRFPDDPDPRRRLAAIYTEQNDENAALREMQEVYRLVDGEAPLAWRIGSIYLGRAENAEAAQWFRRGLDVDPFDADLHEALADSLLDAGQLAAAEREYQAVCKLLPDDTAGYEGLVEVYEAMGDEAKAAELEQKVEEMDKRAEEKG